MKRLILGLAGLACEAALFAEAQWALAGIVGACVVLVIVLAPVAAELREIWGETAARMRRVPEPEPSPPPAPVNDDAGDKYECLRCGDQVETDWGDATSRRAAEAGVCVRCFDGVLGQLKECQSGDDPTMRVEAGSPGGRHERG